MRSFTSVQMLHTHTHLAYSEVCFWKSFAGGIGNRPVRVNLSGASVQVVLISLRREIRFHLKVSGSRRGSTCDQIILQVSLISPDAVAVVKVSESCLAKSRIFVVRSGASEGEIGSMGTFVERTLSM